TPARCDLSGEPLAGAPERSWTVGLEGQLPLSSTHSFLWQLDRRWQSDVLTAVNNSRYSLVEAYELVNLRIGVQRKDGRRELALWARNLLDEEYLQFVSARSTGWIAGLPGDPRTVGMTLRGQF